MGFFKCILNYFFCLLDTKIHYFIFLNKKKLGSISRQKYVFKNLLYGLIGPNLFLFKLQNYT